MTDAFSKTHTTAIDVVLGTAQLDPTYGVMRNSAAIERPCDFLEEAWKLGIRTLDTAPGYGTAQAVIGRCGWSGQLHTKIPGKSDAVGSLTASLKELGVSKADIVYFHDSDVLNMGAEYIPDIHRAVVPRFAKRLGVSVYDPEEFRRCLDIPALKAIQAPMSVVDQRISDQLLHEAAARGVSVFARSVFLQGALLGNKKELPQHLERLIPTLDQLDVLTEETGFSIIELLIAGVIFRPGLSGLVLGADSVTHLREIVASVQQAKKVPRDVIEALRQLEVHERELIDPRRWPRK